MLHIMNYFVTTPEREVVLKPHGDWEGISKGCQFELTVKMDSDYAKCLDTKRSMTVKVVYLHRVSVMFRRSHQKIMSLSTIKAELNATVMDVHYALFVTHGLNVKLPILANIDNGRAVYIGNN